MSARNKETMRRVFEELFNEHQLDLIPDLYCDDCVGRDDADEQDFVGHDSVRILVEGYRHVFPNHRYEILHMIAEGDTVCVHWRVDGLTDKDGGPFGFDALSLCQLRDGRVSRVWQHWDNLRFLKKIGAVPPEVGVGPAMAALM